MAQPRKDLIHTILAELRQELSDTLTLLNIAIALRHNAVHLLTVLKSMLADLALSNIDTGGEFVGGMRMKVSGRL